MVRKSTSVPLAVAKPHDSSWSIAQSLELYGVRDWGESYFDISSTGELVVQLPFDDKTSPVALLDIIQGMN